jgi:hypothetical protein
MVQGAGRIYARLPWHGPSLTELRQYINNETTSFLPPQKNIGSLDAPHDQMVQGAGRIYARLPWHDSSLTELRQYVNNETTSPLSLPLPLPISGITAA